VTTTTMEAPAVKLLELFGTWAGRVLLGPILPPAGGIAGGLIGKQLGSMGGQALSSAMSGANDDAVPKEGVKEETETCEGCRSQKCQDLEKDINRRLYNSKRRPGADGYHGQFPRRAEQICGASGPGTEGWNSHDRILRQQSGELRRLHVACEAAGCKGHPEENINWDDMEWAQIDSFAPAPSEWLGPNNAQCQTAKELIWLNQGREAARLVDSFPRPSGPAIY
jgi:hypothetical protein